MVQLVEALPYKLEGHRFDSQWCQWKLTKSFGPHQGPGANSASNRSEYVLGIFPGA
jgi:hypothetical protein